MTVRDVEAALIRDGYDAVLAGESLASIARMWTAAGALTPVGNAWNHIGVPQVLPNPRNAGLRRHRPAGSELDAKRDPTAFIVGRAQWDPIVEEDTWRAVAHVLTDPSRRRDRGVRALLTGVAVCGVCGGGMSAGSRRAGHPSQYRCAKNPQCFTRQMPPVDEYVCEAVLRRLEAPDALRLFALPDAAGNVDYAAEATTLRRRLDDLAEDYADGALTRQQFRTANERVRVKLADVETAMTRAGARDMIGPLISGGDVRAVWAELSTARRRAVIADVATVTLFPVGGRAAADWTRTRFT